MFLSIIIPLYNEENTIVIVLEALLSLKFPDFVDNYEIIVVDDSSNDSSNEKIKKFIDNNKSIPIKLLKHELNLGKGASVKTGIKNCEGDVVLIQDADLELSPEDIPQMLIAMHKLKVQFINGSRYMAGISRPLSSYSRYIANRIFTLITSFLINVKLTDMACGYKLIHKELLDKISLKENRFGFEAELIVKALRIKKNNIAEVPVNYFPRNEGDGKKLKTSDGFKILWTIIKYSLFYPKQKNH